MFKKKNKNIKVVEEKSTAVSQPTKNPKIKQIIENLDETPRRVSHICKNK